MVVNSPFALVETLAENEVNTDEEAEGEAEKGQRSIST